MLTARNFIFRKIFFGTQSCFHQVTVQIKEKEELSWSINDDLKISVGSSHQIRFTAETIRYSVQPVTVLASTLMNRAQMGIICKAFCNHFKQTNPKTTRPLQIGMFDDH